MGLDYQAVLGYGIEVTRPDHMAYDQFEWELDEYWEDSMPEGSGPCPVEVVKFGSQGEGSTKTVLTLKRHSHSIDVKYSSDKIFQQDTPPEPATSDAVRFYAEKMAIPTIGHAKWWFGIYIM